VDVISFNSYAGARIFHWRM